MIYSIFHNDFHWPFSHGLLKIGKFFGHHVNHREILSMLGSMLCPLLII